MVRKVMPIVRAAQRYAEEARAAQAAAGPSLSPGLELAVAMDAGMSELFAAIRGQRNAVVHAPTLTVGVSFPPVSVVVSDTGMATDTATVTMRGDSPADVGMPLDAKTVFLAILWVMALLLPVAILLLSPEAQTIIMDFLVSIGTALIIHWRVTDSRKH
jgi:hypothetical protein